MTDEYKEFRIEMMSRRGKDPGYGLAEMYEMGFEDD